MAERPMVVAKDIEGIVSWRRGDRVMASLNESGYTIHPVDRMGPTTVGVPEDYLQDPERPSWCPHADCRCVSARPRICVGRLPWPEEHDGVYNTHRWCLEGAGENGRPWDLQVHWGDLWNFTKAFNMVARDEGRPEFITTSEARHAHAKEGQEGTELQP